MRDYGESDLWLTAALECDPEVMKDLGGPTPQDTIAKLHQRRLDGVLAKRTWYSVIVPDNSLMPVGTIGIWQSEWNGAQINEMGWMILPAFQGKGVATTAGSLILNRALKEQKYLQINAFPAASNGASNSICRKLGFSLIEKVALAYNGPPKLTNRWFIDLVCVMARSEESCKSC